MGFIESRGARPGSLAIAIAWCLIGAIPGSMKAQDELHVPAPTSPDEPMAESYSPDRAAEYLDSVALSWTRERQCGACHTNYSYLMARPKLKAGEPAALSEIRAFFEGRVAHWDDKDARAKPRWDTEVVATAAALAINDAATTGKLHPLTRKALDRIWEVQRPDGAWDWLKCNWPPFEHDDYYGATFGALGVGMAPGDYRESEAARPGLEKLRRYFRENPPPSLHHKAMLLWASTRLDGLMTPTQRDQAIRELLATQRPDGGWNLPSMGDWKRRDGTPNDRNSPSDGFGTGFVVYVLRQAGLPSGNEEIRRGVAWLKTHQRASGRWFTRSLSNDKAHYITNAGSGFAIMALAACEEPR